jgi:rRNA maturation protein Nop10
MLTDRCRKCNTTSENTFPPRYSPQDRFGKYRRMTLYGVHDKEDSK